MSKTDDARHAELTRRFPEAYVVRSQAVQQVRDYLAHFSPTLVPARDTMFSLVVDESGLALWIDNGEPFLRLAWHQIGAFSLHSYVDYPIWDMLAIYEGHVTTAVATVVAANPLEFVFWGDEKHDQTESLLDEYGARTVLSRIEKYRAHTQSIAGLPRVRLRVTRLPRFTLHRR